MASIIVNGTSGDDTLSLAASSEVGGFYTFSNNNVAFSNSTSFTFNGLGGTDSFTLTNPAGDLYAPSSGIFYDGGGQPGDSFADLGGQSASGSFSAGSAFGNATLTHVTSEVQRFTISGS